MGCTANSSVFVWKAFAEWRPFCLDIFGDVLTPDLEAKVRQNAKDLQKGHIGLAELIDHPIGSDAADDRIADFRRRYSQIRVFHACRPDDVASYYEVGLLCGDKIALIERFRTIFLNGDFPEITEEMLQRSIQEQVRYSDEGGILYLALDDKWMISYCGHYLIYGSEYLGGLVTQMPTKNLERYRAALRKRGKPTFLEINLPSTPDYGVTDEVILALLDEMLKEWACRTCEPNSESSMLDFTICSSKQIPAENIFSHYYPRRIRDPLNGQGIYDAETGEYGNAID